MTHSPIRNLPALLLLTAAALAAGSRADSGYLDADRFALGLNYTGITYHPGGGENEEHYKRSFDDGDYWVLLVGFQADADYKLHRFLYVRTAASFYKDCADLWAGYYHLGIRANWDATERLSARIGIGPTYLWRQNWLGKVKGYTKDSFFGPAKGGNYQGAFIWYGGDVDVEWKAWDKVSLVYSVIPGYPEVIQNSVGARYNF
ncbi:MAG TPA: hypothetical protein VJ385_07440 [Fibrobacteria bacterium]|nr:hypothetical protein [Fibrobacteria bacterium]